MVLELEPNDGHIIGPCLYVFGINIRPAFHKKNNLEQCPLGNDSLARRMNSGSSCCCSRCWRRTRCRRKRMALQLNTYRVPRASVFYIIIMIAAQLIEGTEQHNTTHDTDPMWCLMTMRRWTRRCSILPYILEVRLASALDPLAQRVAQQRAQRVAGGHL